MNTAKFKDINIRDCIGSGCFSIIDPDTYKRPEINSIDVRFSITGNGEDYTLSMAAGRLMITTLLNSDHILIMKQILKEMGEI